MHSENCGIEAQGHERGDSLLHLQAPSSSSARFPHGDKHNLANLTDGASTLALKGKRELLVHVHNGLESWANAVAKYRHHFTQAFDVLLEFRNHTCPGHDPWSCTLKLEENEPS